MVQVKTLEGPNRLVDRSDDGHGIILETLRDGSESLRSDRAGIRFGADDVGRKQMDSDP
ncbi:MAG: hypothetical protein P1V13_05550 [Rhizobiaceae bacterium]|nr:hypothetical protein [Rhizobiaceae bacterium]